MSSATLAAPARRGPGAPGQGAGIGADPVSVGPAGIALWLYIGVATSLFGLFVVAYVMRMAEPDAVRLALPWPLRAGTAALGVASLALQLAAWRAGSGAVDAARVPLLVGGLAGLGFVCAQGWAWWLLQEARVTLTGHPAASFFYLLSTLHGLHLAGGLLAWALALQGLAARRVRLCARYWHFLLLAWLLLYAALAWVTPEMARSICGVEPA